MLDGVLVDIDVPEANFVDPEHETTNLAHDGPCEVLIVMKGYQPTLNIEGRDIRGMVRAVGRSR
jgi:hypothetical protein